jgi:hypothetical protein
MTSQYNRRITMRTATIIALLLAGTLARADEVMVPAVVPTPTNVIASWKVTGLVIRLQPTNRAVFTVEYTGVTNNGDRVTTANCTVTDEAATTIAGTMNTLDLRSNSLMKRLIAWGQGRGCIAAGAVTGTPGITYKAPVVEPAKPLEDAEPIK